MSKEPIVPTGGEVPWEFEKKGFQERNLETLMDVLSKKEATDAIEAMGETKRETWRDIKESVIGLTDFISLGGLSAMEYRLRNIVQFNIDSIMAPLENTMKSLLTEALAPVRDKLIEITNFLATFIEEGQYGALVGAIGGKVLGMFLPGGPILEIVGALIGSAIQQLVQLIIDTIKGEPHFGPYTPAEMAEYWNYLQTTKREISFKYGGGTTAPGPGRYWESGSF